MERRERFFRADRKNERRFAHSQRCTPRQTRPITSIMSTRLERCSGYRSIGCVARACRPSRVGGSRKGRAGSRARRAAALCRSDIRHCGSYVFTLQRGRSRARARRSAPRAATGRRARLRGAWARTRSWHAALAALAHASVAARRRWLPPRSRHARDPAERRLSLGRFDCRLHRRRELAELHLRRHCAPHVNALEVVSAPSSGRRTVACRCSPWRPRPCESRR